MSETKRGDSNIITREYMDSLLVETRYIGSTLADTGLELYGERFKTPIMTAAFSHLDKFYDRQNGMVETAAGAFAAGAVAWAGMTDEDEFSRMAETRARLIRIIKPYADESMIFSQIKGAENAGALAVGMDIDHIFTKMGAHDVIFGDEMADKTVNDLAGYISSTKLPFVLKGVLSVHDAEAGIEAGAKGLLVSHHHGITDYAVPPLYILPEIVKFVRGRVPIFVDCGIDSGVDAFKALALGADAVCAGRNILQDLVRDGEKGVESRLNAMTRELAGMMAKTGSKDIRSIDPSVIRRV